ncbi:hypothetical protein [Hymenobacter koreensis]|uniref:Uncharacterized protein n=1 Tax=Hymenobacter koreensis TaxID=1084523 RepID=A0ABP8JNI4_9BACT
MIQQHHYIETPSPLYLNTSEEAACPVETEEVRRRFSWKALVRMPWHTVEALFWGVAAEDDKYVQEVPVVLEEVRKARKNPMQVA